MTNKGGKNDDDKTRRDLTRIEDLSEFLHPDDPDVDDKFGEFKINSNEPDDETLVDELPALPTDVAPSKPLENSLENSIDELNVEPNDELIEESSIDFEAQNTDEFSSEIFETTNDEEPNTEESLFEDSATDVLSTDIEENALDFSNEIIEETDFSNPEEANPTEDFSDNLLEEDNGDNVEKHSLDYQPEVNFDEVDENEDSTFSNPVEKLDEVNTFAQNFSYGQIQGGGNPPFSLVIRHLKFKEDAEDILIILREFGLVTDQNLAETEKALEIGALLVPQISEYSAIVLAHKFRRFDCDIEVGLSDEVHPSKSGDSNPRGLIKKENLHQNKNESYKKSENYTPAKDILVTTLPSLADYIIEQYVGVQTSFTVIDEEELNRLNHVQTQERSKATIQNYETELPSEFSSERAFKDYELAFQFLFQDLADQLKMKAHQEKANALLGLSYQLTSLPFEKNINGKNCFQIICSATLAVVRAE